MKRAEQIQTGFALSSDEVPHLVHLCQLLEGLPLGLELAANWVMDLSCAEIVAEIEQGIDFLEGHLYNVPARHRSMRAVFDYSWRLLTPEQQRIFSTLSIFRGGFTRKAANDIAGASLRALVGLSNQSLIRARETGRYEIHELLRQFASEKLVSRGEEEAVQTRHGQYYLTLLTEGESGLRKEEPRQTLQSLNSEIGNIRQAWHWATQARHWSLLLDGARGLSKFYETAGFFQEGERLFTQTTDLLDRAKQGDQCTLRALSCRLRIEQASMLFAQGVLEKAVHVAKGAVELASALASAEDPSIGVQEDRFRLEGHARFELGRCLHKQGEQAAAPVQFERALALAHTTQDRHLEADILRHWCWNCYDRAEFEQAIELQSAAEELYPVDPNLAFLAIFSRDCRDFGVIYSDFGYRKQPISYLKIAQI
ncbi:hypothetical protein KFU94_10225 [Chloroflexi bacterium TSY]|nr:hypothetical protein [Chloroflexi bacterium TSY]